MHGRHPFINTTWVTFIWKQIREGNQTPITTSNVSSVIFQAFEWLHTWKIVCFGSFFSILGAFVNVAARVWSREQHIRSLVEERTRFFFDYISDFSFLKPDETQAWLSLLHPDIQLPFLGFMHLFTVSLHPITFCGTWNVKLEAFSHIDVNGEAWLVLYRFQRSAARICSAST